MFLFELETTAKGQHLRETFEEVDLWEDEGLGLVDVIVEFEFESEHDTAHPIGMGSAREHHPAQITIFAVKLAEDAEMLDEEGTVIRTLKAGMDLTEEWFYKDAHTEFFIDKLFEIQKRAARDDYDEDDY